MKKIAIVIACAAYVICPLDFDFVPIVGWLDDLFVIVMGVQAVLKDGGGRARLG